MPLDTDHLLRCAQTLELSLAMLQRAQPDSVEYEVFRNAVLKGFEITLETSGSLLRQALKAYDSNSRSVDELTYKGVLRYAAKHGLLSAEEVERWFAYRDNRNDTVHDYDETFVSQTLVLISGFVADAQALEACLREKLGRADD